MKVIRLHGAQDVRMHEEALPKAGKGECLVRIRAVGLCGSDLHWFGEGGIGDARLKGPLVLGHEAAGEIADGPRKGERVAIDPAIPCKECEYCQQGNPNLCEKVRFAGHGMDDGTLREFIAWPEECLFPLPDDLSFADGAMLEPLGVAMHAVNLGKLRPGMSVGVFGCGPIGLLIAQLAQLSGAGKVIATDVVSLRVDEARGLGVDQALVVSGKMDTLVQEWQILAGVSGKQGGVDVAFEVAGENAAVETAIAIAKPGGRVVLTGIPADDRTSFSAATARRKGLTLKMVRRMKFTYPRAIQLVESRKVDVSSLVSHRFPLEQAGQAFAVAQRREGLKVIIES